MGLPTASPIGKPAEHPAKQIIPLPGSSLEMQLVVGVNPQMLSCKVEVIT